MPLPKKLETKGFCSTTGRVSFVDGEALQKELDAQHADTTPSSKQRVRYKVAKCAACGHWHFQASD